MGIFSTFLLDFAFIDWKNFLRNSLANGGNETLKFFDFCIFFRNVWLIIGKMILVCWVFQVSSKFFNLFFQFADLPIEKVNFF